MRLTHRPMVARDIKVGKKFIMIGDEGVYKGKIEEVLNPNDLHKSFCSDGCRYELEDCFVKLKEQGENE